MPLGRAGVLIVGIMGMPIPVGIMGVSPGMGPRELIGAPMDMGVSMGIIVGACMEPIPATKNVTGLLCCAYSHTHSNTHVHTVQKQQQQQRSTGHTQKHINQAKPNFSFLCQP